MFNVVAATWLSFVVLQSHPMHPAFSISCIPNETADKPTQLSFPKNGSAWGHVSVISFSHSNCWPHTIGGGEGVVRTSTPDISDSVSISYILKRVDI
ncbi:hypothetical protein BDR22DRAFT_566692 [Usnea florida]